MSINFAPRITRRALRASTRSCPVAPSIFDRVICHSFPSKAAPHCLARFRTSIAPLERYGISSKSDSIGLPVHTVGSTNALYKGTLFARVAMRSAGIGVRVMVIWILSERTISVRSPTWSSFGLGVSDQNIGFSHMARATPPQAFPTQ